MRPVWSKWTSAKFGGNTRRSAGDCFWLRRRVKFAKQGRGTVVKLTEFYKTTASASEIDSFLYKRSSLDVFQFKDNVLHWHRKLLFWLRRRVGFAKQGRGTVVKLTHFHKSAASVVEMDLRKIRRQYPTVCRRSFLTAPTCHIRETRPWDCRKINTIL